MWLCNATSMAALAGAFIFGTLVIWSGKWVLPSGDGCVRAIMALQEPNPPSSLFSSSELVAPWPPGHRIFIGNLASVLPEFGVRYGKIFWYQTLSLLSFVLGTWGFSRVAHALAGSTAALATILLIFCFGIPLDQAASGLTEIFVFGLMGLGFWALICGLQSHRLEWVYAAALCNFAITTLRTEAIVVIFLQWLVLWGRLKWWNVLAWGTISAGYFVTRLAITEFLAPPTSFLNFNRLYTLGDTASKVDRLLGHLWTATFPDGLIPLALFGGAGLALFWRIRKNPPIYPFALRPVVWLRAARSLVALPIWCALASFAFLFSGVQSGNVEPFARYLLGPLPFLAISLALGFRSENFPEIVRAAGRAAIAVALIALAVLMIVQVPRVWRLRDQMDDAEKRFLGWVEKSRPDGIVSDFLRFKDDRLILYARESLPGLVFWGHGNFNPLGLNIAGMLPPSDMPAPEHHALETQAIAQKHLVDPRISYLLVADPQFYQERILGKRRPNKKTLSSFFLSDLEPLAPDRSRLRFRPQFATINDREIVFEKVYGDKLLLLYRKVSSSGVPAAASPAAGRE